MVGSRDQHFANRHRSFGGQFIKGGSDDIAVVAGSIDVDCISGNVSKDRAATYQEDPGVWGREKIHLLFF